MTTSLADESALLAELRALAERGQHREVVERLAVLPSDLVGERTPFALLAAEAHGRLGAFAEAERWADAALRVAHARGERHAELRAQNHRGAIALERGDVAEAESRFAAALGLAGATGDAGAQARGQNNLGIIANLRGDHQAALAYYERALMAYRMTGFTRGLAETYHNIAITWRERGILRRALEAADEAVRRAGATGDDALMGLVLAGRAELHLALGDHALAAAELHRAATAYERAGESDGLAEVWRLQAAAARTRGDLPTAVRLLEQAAALAARVGTAHTQAEIDRDLGSALEARGDHTAARAARERALARFGRLGATKAAQQLAALIGRKA